MYASKMSRRYIRQIELIYANRRRQRLAARRQNVDRGDVPLPSHCCNLHAQAAFVPIILTTFESVALATVATISPRRCPSCGGYEGAIESLGGASTPRMFTGTSIRVGREMTRRLKADMRKMKTRAAPLIHPGRCSPTSVSPIVSLMSSVRVILASVSSSEENRLSERETMRVLRRGSRKSEYSECFEEELVL